MKRTRPQFFVLSFVALVASSGISATSDDLPRRAEHAASRRAGRQSRRQVDALLAEHARLAVGSPSVRHLSRVVRRRASDHSPAHVHEGQERDESEVVARRTLHRLPLRSRRDDCRGRSSRRSRRRGPWRGRWRGRRRTQSNLRHAHSTAAKRSESRTRAKACPTSRSARTDSRSSTRRAERATSRSMSSR